MYILDRLASQPGGNLDGTFAEMSKCPECADGAQGARQWMGTETRGEAHDGPPNWIWCRKAGVQGAWQGARTVAGAWQALNK